MIKPLVVARRLVLASAALLLSPLFLSSSTLANGSTYYVRTDGNDANDGLSNTAEGAWRTIDWAADHASAGDVVRVQAGTYSEVASLGVSGTSGSTVTLVADGAVTTCGMSFGGKNYIRVIGFTMDGNARGCALAAARVTISGTNTGLEFWNNTLVNANHGFTMPNISDRCNACIIVGGSIKNINNSTYGITLTGDDSFVGYVEFSSVCFIGVVPSGNRLRFVNLNFSGFIQCAELSHPDFFYPQGTNPLGYSNSVVESVFGIGTPSSFDNKFAHIDNQSGVAWNDNVWRFIVGHDLGSAALWSVYDHGGAITRWKYYSNSLVYGNESSPSGTACGNIDTPGDTVYIYNSLFFRCWGNSPTTGIVPWNTSAGTRVADYNLAYDDRGLVSFLSPWTNQAHEQSNVNPQLVSVADDNFTLGSSSVARGKGGPLTTASGGGSSSTVLRVAANTGSFFIGSNANNLPQYGGALAPGDFLTVGSTTVQVESRSGDTLILASPISWNNGDPVYFGPSPIVDIGAYPYKSSGYALSADYSCRAGTCTIEPNDASLVRFVVCYDDGVPYAVDNAAPYRCSAAARTFSARAYPRYASKTLWATAGSGSGPSAPRNLRIVQ